MSTTTTRTSSCTRKRRRRCALQIAGDALDADQQQAISEWESNTAFAKPPEEAIRGYTEGVRGGFKDVFMANLPVLIYFQFIDFIPNGLLDVLGMMLLGMGLYRLGMFSAAVVDARVCDSRSSSATASASRECLGNPRDHAARTSTSSRSRRPTSPTISGAWGRRSVTSHS